MDFGVIFAAKVKNHLIDLKGFFVLQTLVDGRRDIITLL